MPKITPMGQGTVRTSSSRPAPADAVTPPPLTGSAAPAAGESPVVPTSSTAPVKQGAEDGDGKPTPEATPTSKQFATLSRREKQLREERRQLQVEREALEQDKAARNAGTSDQSLRVKAKSNLGEALSELGVTYDDIVSHYTQNPPDPAETKFKDLEGKFSTLEKKLTDAEKAQQDQQASQYQNALKQIKADSVALSDTDERFALVKTAGAHDHVVARIEQVFRDEERILSVEEATAQVEDEIEKLVLQLAKIPRIAAKLAPSTEAPKQPQGNPPKPGATTLTHRTVAQTKSTGTPTKAELRQRMIDRFNGVGT